MHELLMYRYRELLMVLLIMRVSVVIFCIILYSTLNNLSNY